MRGTSIIAACLSLLLAFASASPIELSRRAPNTVVTTANVPSSGNVVLQQFTFDADTGAFSGNIWIKNIAFQKVVTVFYSTPSQSWSTAQNVAASYSGPSTNGYELWNFAGTPSSFGPGSKFYLKYTVSGQNYYDNNATNNYLIPSPPTPPPTSTTTNPPTTSTTATSTTSTGTTTPPPPPPSVTVVNGANPASSGPNVLLKEYSFLSGVLAGSIWIKNLSPQKSVNVIASTTTGSWGATAPASYSSTAANGYEIWTFSSALAGLGTGSQFYIKEDTLGTSYYDSNGGFGVNYPITATISPAAAGGFSEDITTFFTNAIPSIKNSLFANIHPAGTLPGVVVAAPKNQPTTPQNYFYHWIRDASLVMDVVNTLYANGDASLEQTILDYQTLTRKLQTISPPALTGFGEAKFNVDGTDYTGGWCRPQNDGPGLRASVFIRFSKAYLAKGGSLSTIINMYNSTASGVIKPDLDYVTLNSYDTNGCDLWEETRGNHLFTQMVQRRALKEGAEFATFLGDKDTATRWANAAAALDSFVLKYWNPDVNTLMTTLNARQLDAAIPLTAIHGYNDDGLYAPSDDKVLNSVYQLANGFISEYTLNQNVKTDTAGRPLSVAIGRYYGDTYNGVNSGNQGNPWYLATVAVAETYYRAATNILKTGSVTVSNLNRAFITGDRPAGLQAGNIAVGTYAKGTPQFKTIVSNLQSLADTYVRRASFHGDVNYRFGEQYLRTVGTANAQGVRDLTWSYASFITASLARDELSKALASANL
ncbi:glycoside hydrolase 15 protein [Phlyctochytrium planicorne]|nr:glycoside hydrolase 15 protein [Phlyctochytrium planicorne]